MTPIEFFNQHTCSIFVHKSKYDRHSKPAWTGTAEIEFKNAEGIESMIKVECREGKWTPDEVLSALYEQMAQLMKSDVGTRILAEVRAPAIEYQPEGQNDVDEIPY